MKKFAIAVILSFLAIPVFAQDKAPDYLDNNKWQCSVCERVTELAIQDTDYVVMYDRYSPVVTPDHPTSLVVVYRPVLGHIWDRETRENSVRAAKASPWLLLYFTSESIQDEKIYIFERNGSWHLAGSATSFEDAMKFLFEKYGIKQK